jgi:biopolymer transport protein ExbB
MKSGSEDHNMSTRFNICFKLSALIPALAFVAAIGFAPSVFAQEEAAPAEDAMPAMESMGAEDSMMGDPMMAGEEGMMGEEGMGGEEAAADPMDVLEGTEDEMVDSPYSMTAMLEEGGFVTRGVFAILVIMSVGSWYIMILRLIDTQVLYRQAAAAQKNFWTAGSLKEGLTKLEQNSAFRAIVDDGLKAAEHHEGKLTDSIDLNEWVTMSLQRSTDVVNARLQGGLAFLASVGSTAPFVGLFGTVWGILNALISIGVSGQVSIDKVAGPLGEALIMTAIGLFVAVPAVLGYNFFVRRNKVLLERVRNFAADIHAVLLSGRRGSQAAE